METVQVRVEQGILEGERKSEYMIFRGVPYAEAPVGDNRFRAPQRKKPWIGVRDAKESGPMCPQPDMKKDPFWGKEFYGDDRYPLPEQNEDCLYLNIWAPLEKGKHPVALWIHGGAFDHGFSSEMEFDGKKFAANGVVLVTINYRVGVFGFFADEMLRRENAHRTTGNYGMLDQVAALQWVWKNIHSFNGDADRITVFGQSAGAMSAQALVSSSLTDGMIHNAILQSGGGIDNGLLQKRTLDDTLATGQRIKSLLKVKTIGEMRKLPASKLVEVLEPLYQETTGIAFGPCVDGYFLKEDPQQAVKNGHIQDIPYMIGLNGNDLTIEKGEDGRKSQFYRGCEQFAKARCALSEKPVYMYYFDRKLPGDDAGAFHSSELWYVFGTLDRCWRPMTRHDYSLSDMMNDAWSSFMKNDDPGRQWKAWKPDTKFVRTFL